MLWDRESGSSIAGLASLEVDPGVGENSEGS
jgi:hypothetical protein